MGTSLALTFLDKDEADPGGSVCVFRVCVLCIYIQQLNVSARDLVIFSKSTKWI